MSHEWFKITYGTLSYILSISPAFHEQLFYMNVLHAAFLYFKFRFFLLWRKKIGGKAALKMLVKLTIVL